MSCPNRVVAAPAKSAPTSIALPIAKRREPRRVTREWLIELHECKIMSDLNFFLQ